MSDSIRFAPKLVLYFIQVTFAYFQKFWFSPIPYMFFRNTVIHWDHEFFLIELIKVQGKIYQNIDGIVQNTEGKSGRRARKAGPYFNGPQEKLELACMEKI